MTNQPLRYQYDFMRFPMEEDDQTYELVVRAQDGKPHAYDIYVFKSELYPYSASLLHYYVDLANYSKEELVEWLRCWGYASLEAFQAYLRNETTLCNDELRLVTCIVENDFFIKPEVLVDGDYDACFDFLVQRLGGRSPLDDTSDETL